MGDASARWPLVGRSEELAMLDDEVGSRSGSVVLAGAVGVGKSRLLAGWLAGRDAQGHTTVVVRATKSTATIPFGAFARFVPERLGDGRDRLAVLRATAARLTRLGPDVVVAVDDAHLLDEGSAALVLHLAQHTRTPVLVAVRSAEPCPDAVVSLWKERIALRLDLQALSVPQTIELLERVLGDTVTVAAQRRVWDLSQGNPLYLREVVEAGRGQGVLRRSAGGWAWRGSLAGRTGLDELVSDRIGASGSAERRILEIVALGEPLPLDVLAHLAPPALLAGVESRGLLATERPAPHEPAEVVRLAHPLYSEVLRAELRGFTARSHHRALADAAIAAGAQHRDPLRVATWLLAGGDVGTEPDLLMEASYLALLMDDCELSARLARAAERAGGGWRATLRRAEALGPLRRWNEVDALLSTLVAPGREPETRAAALRMRAEQAFRYRGEDPATARAAVAEAARLAPPSARSSLVTNEAMLAILALDLEGAIGLATAAVADARTVVDRLNGLACAGVAAVLLGRARAARAIVELATPYAFENVRSDPLPGGALAYIYSYATVLEGRIDEAAEVFGFLLGQDVGQVGGATRSLQSFWLARAALAQGRVGTATRLCREALAVLGPGNYVQTGAWVAATLATAASQSGDPETAATAMATVDTHTGPEGLHADLAGAWVAAARGELSTARTLALGVARRAGGAGVWLIELTALLDAARLGAAREAAPRLAALTSVVDGPY
ncbi:MAG TPA: AAA family ATPase, partial [Acidimicrobiales bacterium]|nr:AAA family ATPase [Acidimicrobiales bacterium]